MIKEDLPVLDKFKRLRHVTEESRSESWQWWLERIWTAMATCAQRA